MPFEFQRIQFPVRLGFAITSNRSQGKTYKYVGICLTTDFFTHGQLYVSLSRVGSASMVKVFKPKTSTSYGYMKDVVYQEVLSSNPIPSNPIPSSHKSSSESNPLLPVEKSEVKHLPFLLQKQQLSQPRLKEIGFKMRPATAEDGNCFIHAVIDQMR